MSIKRTHVVRSEPAQYNDKKWCQIANDAINKVIDEYIDMHEQYFGEGSAARKALDEGKQYQYFLDTPDIITTVLNGEIIVDGIPDFMFSALDGMRNSAMEGLPEDMDILIDVRGHDECGVTIHVGAMAKDPNMHSYHY